MIFWWRFLGWFDSMKLRWLMATLWCDEMERRVKTLWQGAAPGIGPPFQLYFFLADLPSGVGPSWRSFDICQYACWL